jgi:hypothetical protein
MALVLIFSAVSVRLFTRKTQAPPYILGISFQGGSYCARFPFLAERQCDEFLELPLANWPQRSYKQNKSKYEF